MSSITTWCMNYKEKVTMEESQFNYLISQLECIQRSIVDKLEEIRCGNIDIETKIQELSDKVDSINQPRPFICPG